MSDRYTLIKNARIIDTQERAVKDADILINVSLGGIIEEISPYIKAPADAVVKRIDAKGHPVCPTFTDLYAHSGEPAYVYRDKISSTLSSALAGGFGRVVFFSDMPEGTTEISLLRYVRTYSAESPCSVYQAVPFYRRANGVVRLNSFSELSSVGGAIFTDYSLATPDSATLLRAMESCKAHGYRLILRPVERELYSKGAIHKGIVSESLRVDGVSFLCEEIAVARTLLVAKETGAEIHLAAISSANSLDMIRVAKREGVKVTCSVSVNSLSFTENDFYFYGSNVKFAPLLGDDENRKRIIDEIVSGTVDALCTDHSPCTQEEKNLPLARAEYGSVTYQTAFSQAVEALVAPGHIDIFRLVELLSIKPCEILGLRALIEKGEVANINIISLDLPNRISEKKLKSNAKNTPFMGATLTGGVISTIIEGRPL